MEEEQSFLKRFLQGFDKRLGEGEDYREAHRAARDLLGQDKEDAKLSQMFATNPTSVMARDIIGDVLPNAPAFMKSDPIYRQAREDRGMGLSNDNATRLGQIGGTLANDILNDSTRSVWWLLNAPQAVADVSTEAVLKAAQPDLYKHEDTGVRMPKLDDLNKPINSEEERLLNDAIEAQLMTRAGERVSGTSVKDGMITKRKIDPGKVQLLSAPAMLAVNAGMGVLNFTGGSGGYAAALPSEDDPTKTSNVIGEIAAKYFLGKTGNLLPYSDFSKERPDVSREDYNRYKAFKYDKDVDLNPFDDGQMTLPLGIAKYTSDGIHGPEVQFLGRSLPVTTTLTPFVAALAGTALGVRGKNKKNIVRDGLIGGTAGLAAGAVTGLVAEEVRRRAASNVVQAQGGNAESYLR